MLASFNKCRALESVTAYYPAVQSHGLKHASYPPNIMSRQVPVKLSVLVRDTNRGAKKFPSKTMVSFQLAC